MGKRKDVNITQEKPTREKITDWKSFTFVMNNLTEEELLAVDQTPFDGERYAEFLEKLVDNGFDLKLSWDTYSDCYQVTATGAWKGYHNATYCVSARSSEIFDAFHVLWFKIDFVAGWDLSQFVGAKSGKKKRG